jgi:hypothetical protein
VGGAALGAGLLWLVLQPSQEQTGTDGPADEAGTSTGAIRIGPWIGPGLLGGQLVF